MQLSPLYLEQISQAEQRGEQKGEQRGETKIVIRQLKYRLGNLSLDLEQQVSTLSTTQLENLSEALLDFQTEIDLLTWLESLV